MKVDYNKIHYYGTLISMRYFADCHFHVMTMKEPNFAAFINSLYSSPQELLNANATDNYIIGTKLFKGESLIDSVGNTLSAFERPIWDTLSMMEKDLRGEYRKETKRSYEPEKPYINRGKLHIKGRIYDKMIMIPLVMDFSQGQESLDRYYYPKEEEDKLTAYLKATVEGMRKYYQMNPDGLFEFYPFAGINPKAHSFGYLDEFLSKYINTTHRMHKDHTIPTKPFYGIKIYPPLDFNPWPEDPETLEKHRYLYSFCERNRIPIITHCDDQGFRGISANLAWKYTDPASWRTVLENYPGLIIDFAHFGRQYAYSSFTDIRSIQAKMKGYPFSPWFRSIVDLVDEFDHVYADLSFSGTVPDFYTRLCQYLKDLNEKTREKLEDRILFGSDFSVNLLKVESYTEYYSIFEKAQFTDKQVEKFTNINPIDFLGLKENQNLLQKD